MEEGADMDLKCEEAGLPGACLFYRGEKNIFEMALSFSL